MAGLAQKCWAVRYGYRHPAYDGPAWVRSGGRRPIRLMPPAAIRPSSRYRPATTALVSDMTARPYPPQASHPPASRNRPARTASKRLRTQPHYRTCNLAPNSWYRRASSRRSYHTA